MSCKKYCFCNSMMKLSDIIEILNLFTLDEIQELMKQKEFPPDLLNELKPFFIDKILP